MIINELSGVGIMKIIYALQISIIVLLAVSCASSNSVNSQKSVFNNYTSVFPNNEVSDELESIVKSIKMINNITFYKRYEFQNGLITAKNLNDKHLLDRATIVNNINQTSAGTGTIISNNGTKVALLTVAHIVSYPDTVIKYYTKNGMRTKYIASIALKVRQQIYADLPEGGRLRLIAKDDKSDIAIVGNSFVGISPLRAPVLKFKFGTASELKWGSFVYIFGFPMGNKMVTRGIVSSPNKGKNGGFLVDASINRGSSGGLVFAIRGEAPNFELVGMVSAVPADKEFVLAPYKPKNARDLIGGVEYSGKIGIKRLVQIKYGIGKIVPVEVIQDFFKKHKEEILKKGFDLNIL